jgi:lipopolysaccharide transport system ATP-binding protein
MAVPIEIEGLGKQYRLGAGTDRLSDRVHGLISAPMRLLGRQSSESGTGRGDELWALRDVTLSVDQGEVVGLIGRNGAGKSTLLKLLSRITPPSEGRIVLRGRVGSMLEVGTGFHPELTGRENIFLNGAMLGMSREEVAAKYDEIVAFSGVERFLDTPVKRYSSGMFVRLAFSVAAHLEPEILLVDEVLAVGDAAFQRQSLQKMLDVSSHGRTIVFVSHNMAAIKRLCSRVYWIDEGRVRETGPSERIVDDYLRQTDPVGGEGSVTIAKDVPRLGTGEAHFMAVALSGSGGAPKSAFALGEALVADIELDVHRDLEDVVLEVGVTTADGQRVVTTQSVDFGRPTIDIPIGKARVTVDLAAQLLPGEFSLDLAVHYSTGQTIDFVERALRFAVVNVSESDPEDYYRWPVVRGFTRVPSEWSIRSAEAEVPATGQPIQVKDS